MDQHIELSAIAARQQARFFLDRLLIDWRKELWPDRSKDPIWLEEHHERIQATRLRIGLARSAVSDRYGAFGLIG